MGRPSICILKWKFCNLQSCGCQQSKRKPYVIRARCCQRSTHRLPRPVPRAGGYRRLEIANRRQGGLGIVPAIGNARNGTRASPRNTEHKACPGDNLTPAGKARIHHCSRIEKRRAKRPASPLDHRDGVRSRVCLTGNDREIANCKLNNANWQSPTIESHRGLPVNLHFEMVILQFAIVRLPAIEEETVLHSRSMLSAFNPPIAPSSSSGRRLSPA
ncbi:hypothetical protein Enr13x_04080 [Stieleria neptunia]|uniref:Uncharacterized protein n=1 Tax=Stieleria neptunia TaxID=2527979 RepID=A0A518HIE2_9BACT|nr:hypothetical protein Enr13x_04080 [Stieleria neptunia]